MDGRRAAGGGTPRGRSRALLMPLGVLLLGLLSLGLLGWAGRITRQQARTFAVADALMDVQIHAATFHLWLEEHIVESPAKPIEEVWRDLRSALALCDALLRGGTSERGLELGPLADGDRRRRVEAIRSGLLRLRDLGAERLASPADAGIGSPLDELFDQTFLEFQAATRGLEGLLEEESIRRQAWWRRLTAAVFAVWALIIGAATAGLFRHQRRRVRDEVRLRAARAELEEANRELESRVRQKTESLRWANEGLSREVAERRSAQEALFAHQERLRALSSQLSLAEQRERRRIATELHDRVGTALAFAKMKLLGDAGSACAASPAAQEVVGVIDRVIEEARSLTFELSPPALHELGLGAALDWLVGRFRAEHGLDARFVTDAAPGPVSEDLCVLLYQAVRELLVNVVKHARAHRVRVTCARDGEDLRLTVEDDGAGFPEEALERSGQGGGFGLFSVRERLGAVGGALEIESGPRGSRVTLLAPLSDPVAKGAP